MNTNQDYVYDFSRSENQAAFEAKRAHVVCCAWGGYGVLEYAGFGVGAARGIKRHGYELGRSGKLTREQAEMVCETLNYRHVSAEQRSQLRKELLKTWPELANYLGKNGYVPTPRPDATTKDGRMLDHKTTKL